MHTDKRLFRWHDSWIAVVIVLSLLLVSGCTTTKSRLTAEDKSQLGRIGITKAYEKPTVIFAGVPSAAGGAAKGIVGGLLYPPAWLVGGPLFFGPVLAIQSSRCRAQFADVKDPDQQFEAAVNATRPDEVLLRYLADRIEGAGVGRPANLEPSLKRLDKEKFDATSIADQRIDTVLQIEQFKFELIASYSTTHGESIAPCFPEVTGYIVWHLIRIKDGKQIATGADHWSVTFAHGFPAVFQDAALMQSILNKLLEKVASGTMCESLLGGKGC